MKNLVLLLFFIVPSSAFAHVKWFSDYSFQNPPLNLSQITTPYFWRLFILSLLSLPAMVYLDRYAEKSTAYIRVNSFLNQYADNGPLIMRIAMGAVLLMSWQGDSIIAPEIPIPSAFWGWFEFGLALCLIFRQTTFITGVGVIFLYALGIKEHGIFHMLDYVVYPAVGVYLILSHLKNERLRNFDLPVLYSGLGFSLCWVSFEKMIYPFWGLSVLSKAPELTMGLPHDFFLLATAFVEFTLGYLLIICLLHRPLAIIITLTFFTTTAFFGKTEIVGHTILHGALLVFIVKGPGHYYQAPIRFHKALSLRSLFAMVNFIFLFLALAFPYQKLANDAHAKSLAEQAKMAHPKFEVPAGSPPPEIMLHSYKDSMGGWNIHLMTKNFKFSPEMAGKDDVMGEGHAHLFINGKKAARVYGDWAHISIGKGTNKIKVNLTTNSHKDYYHNGKAIEAEIELNEDREVTVHAH